VAVSMFYHLKKYRKLDFDTPFDAFIPRFNDGSVSKFGTWVEHVTKWINNVPRNFLLIKYENMHLDPISSLKKVLSFAGIRPNEKRIISAVRASDFSNMKRAEVEQHNRCDTLIGSDERIHFVRNAQLGEWRKYFSEEMQRKFLQIHGSALKALNYNINCNSLDLPEMIHRNE
jgi:aryl sulfotransferase